MLAAILFARGGIVQVFSRGKFPHTVVGMTVPGTASSVERVRACRRHGLEFSAGSAGSGVRSKQCRCRFGFSYTAEQWGKVAPSVGTGDSCEHIGLPFDTSQMVALGGACGLRHDHERVDAAQGTAGLG